MSAIPPVPRAPRATVPTGRRRRAARACPGPAPAAQGSAPPPAGRRSAARTPGGAGRLAAATALLATLLWLAATGALGFTFTPDSMSYAALATGFDSGRPFTSAILAWGTGPGLFRDEWPPLYPGLIAALHALGPSLPWAEYLLSGAGFVAAAVFGALAVRTACGSLPWAALPLLAGFAPGLYVAEHGWSEPLCLGLLGLHFWLAARAARGDGRGPARSGLLCAQAFVAGLAVLDRYAAAAFVPAALALPAALRSRPAPPAREAGRRNPWRGVRAAAVGAAAAPGPWIAACLLMDGAVGPAYRADGAGVRGALAMTRAALRQAAGAFLLARGGAPTRGAEAHAALAEAACLAAGVALALLPGVRRGPRGGPAKGCRGLMAGLMGADAVLSAALIIVWRARYRFDPVDLRLLTPSLYAGCLAFLVAASFIPWRAVRNLLVLPLSALALWHGVRWAGAAWRAPSIPGRLAGPWCSPGSAGDCGMMRWLAAHTGAADLVVSNAAFTINFTLGRTAEEIEPPPTDPVLTAPELASWTDAWDRGHPGGRVFLALDGAVAVPAQGSGPLVAGLWAARTPQAVAGLEASPAARGPAYRIWILTPAPSATATGTAAPVPTEGAGP